MTRGVVHKPCPALRLMSCLALLGLIAAAGSNVWASEARSGERIATYKKWVKRHPMHYLPRVQLGEAMLEQARLTQDPIAIAQARESLLRSLELQPNFRAYRALSALSNFTHRFEDALHWSKLASEAVPHDTSLLAQRVEALLGLERVDDVARLLAGVPGRDFFSAVSLGRWHAASGRVDEAVEAFATAVELADEARVKELGVWARVAAGAVLLDSGRPEEAAPHLKRAAAVDPREDPSCRVARGAWAIGGGASTVPEPREEDR